MPWFAIFGVVARSNSASLLWPDNFHAATDIPLTVPCPTATLARMFAVARARCLEALVVSALARLDGAVVAASADGIRS